MNFIPVFGDTPHQIKWFVIIYVLTIIPCWISVYFVIKNILVKNTFRILVWSFILLVLLAAPYAFVLLTMRTVHWVYWLVLLLFVAAGYYKFISKPNTLSVNWFWDWYARSYDALLSFAPYRILIRDIVVEIQQYILPERKNIILELGCGTGNIALSLSMIGNLTYTGVDASQKMLTIAKKKIGANNNFTFLNKNIDDPNFSLPNKFDIVVINNVLYALKNHEQIIDLVARIINEHGVLIVSEPLRNSSIADLTKGFLRKGGAKAFFQIIMHLFPFLFILIANVIITQIEHIKKKNFFEEQELYLLVKRYGLEVVSSKKVYEKQNILLVAKQHTV